MLSSAALSSKHKILWLNLVQVLSYAKALKKTGSRSVEAIIRQRWLLFAGALARQDGKRLPKRCCSPRDSRGGGDPGPGQPAQHWQKSLRDDFNVFGALHDSTPTDRRTFGVNRLVWTEAARKGEGVPWYTGVRRRRDLWRRGTRAKKRLASYAR